MCKQQHACFGKSAFMALTAKTFSAKGMSKNNCKSTLIRAKMYLEEIMENSQIYVWIPTEISFRTGNIGVFLNLRPLSYALCPWDME